MSDMDKHRAELHRRVGHLVHHYGVYSTDRAIIKVLERCAEWCPQHTDPDDTDPDCLAAAERGERCESCPHVLCKELIALL